MKMNDVLMDIAENPEYKLSEIWRYAGKVKSKDENVAEHSYYTALNIIKLGNHLGVKRDDIFKAVAMAIVHDVPEYLVGDVPYEFKVANPKIMEEFNILEWAMLVKEYKDNELLLSLYQDYALQPKSISVMLVEFGDRMSAWQFALREQKLGNETEEMEKIINRSVVDVNDLYYKIKEVVSYEQNQTTNN